MLSEFSEPKIAIYSYRAYVIPLRHTIFLELVGESLKICCKFELTLLRIRVNLKPRGCRKPVRVGNVLNAQCMKLFILSCFTVLLFISFNAKADLNRSGRPTIIWEGDPWTSTKGKLYCSGSIMFTCCQQIGPGRIWIFGDYNFAADVTSATPEEQDGDDVYSELDIENVVR